MLSWVSPLTDHQTHCGIDPQYPRERLKDPAFIFVYTTYCRKPAEQRIALRSFGACPSYVHPERLHRLAAGIYGGKTSEIMCRKKQLECRCGASIVITYQIWGSLPHDKPRCLLSVHDNRSRACMNGSVSANGMTD
jgi:hypothetical protein